MKERENIVLKETREERKLIPSESLNRHAKLMQMKMKSMIFFLLNVL